MAPSSSPSRPEKRFKLSNDDRRAKERSLLHFLATESLPVSLAGEKIGNNVQAFQTLLQTHGLRNSFISTPRPAVSVYKDSCILDKETELYEGKEFLLLLLGLHPDQTILESLYETRVKDAFCLRLFCLRIREACPQVSNGSELDSFVLQVEESIINGVNRPDVSQALDCLSRVQSTAPQTVVELIHRAVASDSRLRKEQLQHEYDRLSARHCTLANAVLQRLVDYHGLIIKDIFFNGSCAQPKYERIAIYLHVPTIDETLPPHFLYLPSLAKALTMGAYQVAHDMVDACWRLVLQQGYFATAQLRDAISPELHTYFLSGLTCDQSLPLQLNAHFTPSYPLSFYFFGSAGSGKSSLLRNFVPAINATISAYADPEVMVRFVKQNLNKPVETLALELELRPNNNDLSVMSIVQGRRMSLAQPKPGLVLVGLEEMPANDATADPNQFETSRLISQRFAGRLGDYRDVLMHRWDDRGISCDACVVPVFTSNYELDDASFNALRRLKMFHNLKLVSFQAVSGVDRAEFAKSYLHHRANDMSNVICPPIHFDVPLGDGDSRPLVRHLRMIAFFISELLNEFDPPKSGEAIKVVQEARSITVCCCGRKTELRLGAMETVFPVSRRVFKQRTKLVIQQWRRHFGSSSEVEELSIIIDFWLAGVLAPAVIVSTDRKKIRSLMTYLGVLENVHCITDIDAGEYKMMKSLYDGHDTPNLRDDILAHGRDATVAIELVCCHADAQLCIRELVEDSPSMTAFSTDKSALYKIGLLFAVYIAGEITPQILSRASLII